MDTKLLEHVGKSLYKTNILKEYKRYVVFMVRCRMHSKHIEELQNFFEASDLRKAMLHCTPSFLEQTTRAFFYKKSNWDERKNLVRNHIEILEEKFNSDFVKELYVDNDRIRIWEDIYLDKSIGMDLWFHAGQRKEGCLSLVLNYAGEELYQIMFWLNRDIEGKLALYVGALQGPQNGSEIIKELTKAFFGYRTKNLIFFGIRNVAKVIGVERIYAVANEGYYAMNHIRRDRKLKTDFGEFWQECEGVVSADKRFYVIPVEEARKPLEDIASKKRAQYRRRFAKLDEIEISVVRVLGSYKK